MFNLPCRLRPWSTTALVAVAFFACALPRAGAEAPPEAAQPAVTVNRFQRILVADSQEKAAALKAPPHAGPVVVEDVPVLATKEFADYVAHYLGQPITTEAVNHLATDIGTYVRKHDRLVVNVLVPNQDISAGEFRLAVVIGRYSQLQFKGNRWFSNKLLESKLGVKPGDEVRLSTLERAVDWANTNPFRHVQVIINTLNMQPGNADLDVSVQERIPIRVAASYDDTGNDLIGNNHYTASLQFGNLWGLDHQASYQYTTTDISHVFQEHALDYRIPLKWHHYLQFSGAYALVRPSFEHSLFNITGKNIITDLRYIAPVQKGAWSFEFSGGVDFKQINNNLLFGGQQTRYKSNVDIAQATAGITSVRKDSHGSWVFAANGNFSPGGFNSKNTAAAFASARALADPRYVYGDLVLQRVLSLPAGCQFISRGQLQLSSANLVSSEQLTIGGVETVRGYDERIFAGDTGVVINEQLQGPVWEKHLPFFPKTYRPLQSRALIFWDYGRVAFKHRIPADIPLDPLMSAGVGIRSSLASNMNLSADWGWQLLQTTIPQPRRSRGHIRITIAY